MSIFTILERIKQIQIREPTEEDLLKEALDSEEMTFFNWECPPRSDLYMEDGELTCSWNVDIEKGIDKTRMVQRTELEKSFIERVKKPLEQLGKTVKYKKFVAGTNPILVYPRSFGRDTIGLMDAFTIGLQKRVDELFCPGEIEILNFYYTFLKWEAEYRKVFREIMDSFDTAKSIIKGKLLRQEIADLSKKVSPKPEWEQAMELFGKRVVSSYATENWILAKDLSNPVSNSNEAIYNGPKIANSYRKFRGEKDIPGIFVLYKGGGKNEV